MCLKRRTQIFDTFKKKFQAKCAGFWQIEVIRSLEMSWIKAVHGYQSITVPVTPQQNLDMSVRHI